MIYIFSSLNILSFSPVRNCVYMMQSNTVMILRLTETYIFYSSFQWQILGQTVKSVDEKPDKHFDEQQMLGKMNNLNQKVNCPKCQNRPELRMTEEELTKLRIEYVKNQILKKLRLTERPNVSATNLPRPIAEGSMIYPEDEEVQQHHVFEQFYGKTTQKIIFLELGK